MQHPVLLIFRLREVADGGAKDNFSDGKTDLVAVRGKGNVDVNQNDRR